MSELEKKVPKSLRDISPVRLIVSSFFAIIVLGTALLYLPIASRNMQPVNLIDALFTATSATCVTGLTPFDTYSQWSAFGQVVIILLIQFGGLGIVTFATGFTLFFRKKLGLRDMQIAKEYTSGSFLNVTRLIKTILIWSLGCEVIGALLFAIRFVPQFGVAKGLWISVFTAISAYCNAGFDIMGFIAPGTSFIAYATDPLVSLTASMLVILGGVGFVVISDIYSCISNKIKSPKTHFKLNLHSFIVLFMSVTLLVLGTVLFMFFEYDKTLAGYNFWEKLNISFFQATVVRTAGFFSVPIGQEKTLTKLLTVILMFIGASSASTGGGIKTTTLVVILATLRSVIRGYDDTVILRHKVEKFTVYKAFSLTMLAFFLVSIVTAIIAIVEATKSISILDIIFETVSAFATVGLTTGITGMLSNLSKALIMLMMFIGRVGAISFIFSVSLMNDKNSTKVLPSSKIIVG